MGSGSIRSGEDLREGEPGVVRRLWLRLSRWLDIDQSHPVDLLETDPVKHFQNWDRDLPNRYWG